MLGSVPARGAVAHRGPVESPGRGAAGFSAVVAPAVSSAALLLLAWLLADPRSPDLAAQVYRVGLYRQVGFAVFDEHWYAGHMLPGYSLLFPMLGALLGVRALGAVSVLVSTALFALLVREGFGHAARWGAVAFAVAVTGDVWMGRLSFALGVPFALAAALVYARAGGRVALTAAAALLAALAAAASPVAGALLGLAAVTLAVDRHALRPLFVLALPAAVVVVGLAALFPEGGTEPFPTLSFLAAAGVAVAFLAAVPRGQRLLRTGGAIYLLACLACLLVHSPVGSNVERYGVLLAAPLLLASRPRPGAVGAVALAAIAVWVLWGPVRETSAVAGSPATSAAYYVPLERFLERVPGPVRVEVPLTRTHWEAALLAPKVSLARGWEKQLDERYDGVLLSGALTAASYRRWLDREAVSYVALPDVALDPSSRAEGRVIRSHPGYLREVFRSRHWRVFAVLGAAPLASGPGTVTRLGHDGFTLKASGRGTIVVRVRDTRYWSVTAGRACVGAGPEGFTEVRAAAAGVVSVQARFSLGRALGSGGSCSGS